MPNTNKTLSEAIYKKNDEVYTTYETIEREMKYYTKFFEGKTIYCNCDNPYHSNFVKYFMDNFDKYKLKRVISTCMNTKCFKYQYDNENVGIYFDSDIHNYEHIRCNLTYPPALHGNGDFRSEECIKYLQEADIVVTNPPFSLQTDFMLLLEKYNKKYIILGNINNLFCKRSFQLIYNKRCQLGVTQRHTFFNINYEKFKLGFTRWITNLQHGIKKDVVILTEKYNPSKYPKYIDTDVINVNKTKDIPKDYYGLIACPITYLDKHDEEQFDIVGIASKTKHYVGDVGIVVEPFLVGGNREVQHNNNKKKNRIEKYKRIIIKRHLKNK